MMAWDAIEYFREHRAQIQSQISAGAQKATAQIQRHQESSRPEVRLQQKTTQTRALLAKWERKLKFAGTKVKKYRKALARHQGRLQQLRSQVAGSSWLFHQIDVTRFFRTW
jgi:chromosome segregation ATPase